MSLTSQQTCVRQEIDVKAWCTPVSEVGWNEPRASQPFPNAMAGTNKLWTYLFQTRIHPQLKLPFQVRDHHTPVSVITQREGHFTNLFIFPQGIRPTDLYFHGFIIFQLDTQWTRNHFLGDSYWGILGRGEKGFANKRASSAQYPTLPLMTLTLLIRCSAQLKNHLCLRMGAKQMRAWGPERMCLC